MNIYKVENQEGVICNVLSPDAEYAEQLAMEHFKELASRVARSKNYWTYLSVVFVKEFDYEAQVLN